MEPKWTYLDPPFGCQISARKRSVFGSFLDLKCHTQTEQSGKDYPPGNQHIPPWKKENHLQNAIIGGYVSSLEGMRFISVIEHPNHLRIWEL